MNTGKICAIEWWTICEVRGKPQKKLNFDGIESALIPQHHNQVVIYWNLDRIQFLEPRSPRINIHFESLMLVVTWKAGCSRCQAGAVETKNHPVNMLISSVHHLVYYLHNAVSSSHDFSKLSIILTALRMHNSPRNNCRPSVFSSDPRFDSLCDQSTWKRIFPPFDTLFMYQFRHREHNATEDWYRTIS